MAEVVKSCDLPGVQFGVQLPLRLPLNSAPLGTGLYRYMLGSPSMTGRVESGASALPHAGCQVPGAHCQQLLTAVVIHQPQRRRSFIPASESKSFLFSDPSETELFKCNCCNITGTRERKRAKTTSRNWPVTHWLSIYRVTDLLGLVLAPQPLFATRPLHPPRNPRQNLEASHDLVSTT